jgi:hypothetical protein
MADAGPMPLALLVPAARDLLGPGIAPSTSPSPSSGAGRRPRRSPVVLAARFAELCAVGPVECDRASLDTAVEEIAVSARRSLDEHSLAGGRVCGAVRLLAVLAAGPADDQLMSAGSFVAAGIDAVVVDVEIDRLASGDAAGLVDDLVDLASARSGG